MKNNRGKSVTGGRTKMRGAGTNDAVVYSSKINGLGATDSGGYLRSTFTLDPLNGAVASASVNGLAGAYEYYRIRSAEVTFQGTGGFTALGDVTVCYVSNPELIYNAATGGSGTFDSILYNEQGVEVWCLSDSHTKRMNTSRQVGRQWYSCNYALSTNTLDIDRTIPAAFMARFNTGIAGAGVKGILQFRITYEFRGLGNSLGMTLAAQALSQRIPYTRDEDFPTELELYKRTGETKQYQLVVSKPPPPSEGLPVE